MKKEMITFEQLAVLSYTKFARLDGLDMTILKNLLSDVVDISVVDDNGNYLIMSDGRIVLEQNYINLMVQNLLVIQPLMKLHLL